MSRSALLALPSPRIHPAVEAAIDARAGQTAGSGYTEIRQCLLDQVQSGCLLPDGSPAPSFAATLADCDFAAFATHHGSNRLKIALKLLKFMHTETGDLVKELEAMRASLG